MKKLLSLSIALLMAVATFLPLAVAAEEGDLLGEIEISEEEIGTYKSQIEELKKEAEDFRPTNDTTRKMVEDYNEKTKELEEGIERSCNQAQNGVMDNIGQLYNLASIPERIMLVAKIATAIRFATTELRFKVADAHLKMAEYVARGLMMAVNPFSEIPDMKRHEDDLEPLKAELLSYPDIEEDSVATIYVKSDLVKAIRKARRVLRVDLREATQDVYDDLHRAIRDAVSARFKIGILVKDVYRAIDDLTAAVNTALDRAHDERAANRYEKKALIEARKMAKRARAKGNKSEELLVYINEATRLIHQRRASAKSVNELVIVINRILEQGSIR